MSKGANINLPTIVNPIITGAYGRQGKNKIKQKEVELIQRVKENELHPKRDPIKRLRWDNLNRNKYVLHYFIFTK
jgi:hypothetical protein